MLLKNLIKNSKQFKNLKIKGLALNSSDVKKDYIFFALKGTKLNGENFINEAIKKGGKLSSVQTSARLEVIELI